MLDKIDNLREVEKTIKCIITNIFYDENIKYYKYKYVEKNKTTFSKISEKELRRYIGNDIEILINFIFYLAILKKHMNGEDWAKADIFTVEEMEELENKETIYSRFELLDI